MSYCRIQPKYPYYLSLAYPLMFPYEDRGFIIAPLGNLRGHRKREDLRVSLRQFFRYHLYHRDRGTLLSFAFYRLFQQFVVDAWASCEDDRISYYRMNQATLR